MIEAAMFVRMLRERLKDRQEELTSKLANGLGRKEYHRTCGHLRETIVLEELIDELVQQAHEDGDDEDYLTKQ